MKTTASCGSGQRVRKASVLRENDILFAHKALNIMPDLTEATRRVAAAIIDHFNKRTGQCDPGIKRLCDLLGLSRSTVIRATEALCKAGLIEKDSHGGKSHRASYCPNWEAFRDVVDEWDSRMKSGPRAASNAEDTECEQAAKVSRMTPLRSHGCDLKGRTDDTQTLRINQSNKPIGENAAEKPTCKQVTERKPHGSQGLSKEGKRHRQRTFLLPMTGGRKMSRGEVSLQAAQSRWEQDARERGDHVYAAITEWMNEGRLTQATEAERAQRGGGLEFIVNAMMEERRTAAG